MNSVDVDVGEYVASVWKMCGTGSASVSVGTRHRANDSRRRRQAMNRGLAPSG